VADDVEIDRMALAYWSENIRPTLGDLPIPGLRHLRDRYVMDVRANPEALRQVREWWFSSPFATAQKTDASGESGAAVGTP
jgi:hypothetical protein